MGTQVCSPKIEDHPGYPPVYKHIILQHNRWRAEEDMAMLRTGVALAALVLALAGARAEPVADFYNGKQVSLIVGYGSGGGYDVYGRLFARHLGRHIPGAPNVIVQNMPGAGSLRAVNYLYNSAPKEGTAIAIFARDMPLLGIIGHNPNVRFDPRKFTWLGSSSSYINDAYFLFVRSDAQVNTIEDARRPGGPPLVLGGTAEGATGNDIATVVRDALGFNIKLIAGYPDSNALFLAVDRKELDGRFVGLSATSSSHPEWLMPNGGMEKLLQFARVTRHPEFPDVPTARELALNDKSRALIALAELPYRLSRPFAAPPGVPQERAEALQKAFLAVHEDPQYLEEAAKLKIDVSPIGGADVLRAIEDIASAPPEMLDYMKKLLADNKGGG
jgi:tripartite-type tricarboxylate transporter receptor subunit TctC